MRHRLLLPAYSPDRIPIEINRGLPRTHGIRPPHTRQVQDPAPESRCLKLRCSRKSRRCLLPPIHRRRMLQLLRRRRTQTRINAILQQAEAFCVSDPQRIKDVYLCAAARGAFDGAQEANLPFVLLIAYCVSANPATKPASPAPMAMKFRARRLS
jgi:hypothetical protein